MSAQEQLIILAAEILRDSKMPSEFYEDWMFCTGTPQLDRGKVICSAKRAREQCQEWAVTLREIAVGMQSTD